MPEGVGAGGELESRDKTYPKSKKGTTELYTAFVLRLVCKLYL